MKLLDLTLPTPAENLACEEALLDACEAGQGEEILRFWEAHAAFVVVGYANKVDAEVDVAACAAKDVPIYRRCSGGGTVLQGAGCLNYALILGIAEDGPCRTITSANQFIMERNRSALEAEIRREQPAAKISIMGHTDLALDERKFSGNSQRRKKNFLLFHGTFLLNFNLTQVGECLRMPSWQPDYRAGRSHDEFLVNLHLCAEQIKSALKNAWDASDELNHYPAQETQTLAARKYSTEEWNFKF